MLDVVYSEFSTPTAGDEWRPACRSARSRRASVLAQHPWAISIKARTSPGPATLGHLDAVIGCLRAAGFSMPLIGHAMSILDSYVQGFAQQEAIAAARSRRATSAPRPKTSSRSRNRCRCFPNLPTWRSA